MDLLTNKTQRRLIVMKAWSLVLIILMVLLFSGFSGYCADTITPGKVIIAARTSSVGGLGHIGVAIQNADGTWTAGAIEGDPDKNALNKVIVLHDEDNGGWYMDFKTEEEVIAEFSKNTLSADSTCTSYPCHEAYNKIKIISVENSNPESARKAKEIIQSFKNAGYIAPFDDCLTQTKDVLDAYGFENPGIFEVGKNIADTAGRSIERLGELTGAVLYPNDYFRSLPGEEILLSQQSGNQQSNTEETAKSADESDNDKSFEVRSLHAVTNPLPDESNTDESLGVRTLRGVTGQSQDESNANSNAMELSGSDGFDSNAKSVTLTLYVHDGSANGPKISGAMVTGKDGAGINFEETTKSDGYVEIVGDPGTWSFKASADGYETNSWNQKITKTSTKHAFLEQKRQEESAAIAAPVTLTLYVHDGSASGPKISGAMVAGKDGAGISFKETTKSDGYVEIVGDPGTWSFKASADGYETNSWDQKISKTSTKHAFLEESSRSNTQASESSIVGTWLVTQDWGKWQFMQPEDPTPIEFNEDGTLNGFETGSWTQSGNTIHWEFDYGRFPESKNVLSMVEAVFEGTIEANTMKGTITCKAPMDTSEGEQYLTGSWSATKIDA
jgi:hypothetical protein